MLNIYRLEYRLLIIYIYLVFFGSWGLKLLGMPVNIGLALLSVMDIFPFVLWLLTNPSFQLKQKHIFINSLVFWILWGIVLMLLLLSSFRHGGSWVSSVVHWGALVRYIPVAYVVLTLGKHMDITRALLRHLKIITVILLCLGYVCILLQEKAILLLPLLPEHSTGEREALEGNYSAIFANTIDYGFLLVALYAVMVYKKRFIFTYSLLWTFVFFFPVLKTGSVISVFGFCVIAFFRLTRNCFIVRWLLAFCILVIVGSLGYIYWDWVVLIIENMKLSRLGILTNTAPDFLSEWSMDTFWGMGNDGYVVADKINSYQNEVYMLKFIENGDISCFGDVYWVALFIYHGLIGYGIIIYLFYMLYRSVIGTRYIDRVLDYRNIVMCFFFLVFLFGFFNQVLVVKTFSLVFWIIMAVSYMKLKVDLCKTA